ncbi:MAG TPA: hypothetical protein VGE07_04585, partial [Herpetosiphonaceae bacterium]
MGAGCGGEVRRMAGRLAHQLRLSLGMALAMAPASLLLPPPLAVAVAFFGWAVVYGRAFEDDSKLLAGWGWLVGFIGPLGVCMGFADYAAAQFGPIVRGASVTEARLHPGAGGFEFSAATVRREFAITSQVTTSSGK